MEVREKMSSVVKLRGVFTLRKISLLLCCVCLLLTATVALGIRPAFAAGADSLNANQWYWRNPLPTNNSLSGICYGNQIFVAVGANGTIVTSPDGKTWTSQNSGTNSPLDAVCNNNGNFVAVGAGGAIIQAMVSGQSTQPPASNPIPVVSSPGEQLIIFTIGQNSLFVNGQSYSMDAAPFISSGRTLVPVRYLADALGAQTSWDAAAQKVTINKGATAIDLTINSMVITTNGKTTQMDSAPLIENGRTYLPARYIAEALGYTVQWNAAGQTVNIVGMQ